ncbi:MAG: hypothetical protein IJT36_01350 [Alphaproteobacteria bacterium]|nr:hypothetical protein [Alphaproteobacteria bacterium]
MKKRKKKEFDMLTDDELQKLFPPIRTNDEDAIILFLSRVIGGIDDALIINAEKHDNVQTFQKSVRKD